MPPANSNTAPLVLTQTSPLPLKRHRSRISLLHFPWSPQCTTGFRTGMLAVFDDLHAIDENVLHPNGVLMRFFKGGMIGDRRRIEHDDVGEHSLLHKSTVIKTEIG